MRKLFVLILLCISVSSFSQVTINGQNNPSPAAQEYYEAAFDYTLHPYANISWTVTGGTIISQNTNPTATPIWCIVEWDNAPGTGSIILNEDLNGGYAELQVQVGETQQSCQVANAGPDVTLICGSAAVIGTPAVAGYSYSWRPTSGFPLYPSGLSNPNIAQPTASPASFKTYTLTVTAQDNLIVNSDFEAGMSGFNTDYGTYPNGIGCADGGVFGSVSVVTNPANDIGNQYCSFTNYSTNGTKSLFIDGSCNSSLRFWYQTVNVQPNTTYYFSGFFSAASTKAGYTASDALKIRVKVNGVIQADNWNNNAFICGDWKELAFSWNSGTAGTAIIELFDMNTQKNMNDFSMDDLYFGLCPRSTDQVNVFVPQGNVTISPAGPIDYYYWWEAGEINVGITLTSSSASNNQWYKNNIPIPGATGQTYIAKAHGNYTVKVNNCTSASVFLNPIPYGYADKFGKVDYPAGINSPGYYCYNTTNRIKQFDLGSSATYSWVFYEQNNNTPQLQLDNPAYNLHNPQANVIINPAPAGYNYTYTLGKAQLNNYVKAIEYLHFFTPAPAYSIPNYNECPNTAFTVKNYYSQGSTYIQPGSSEFEWEIYDFGPATITNPNPALYPDPSDPSNRSKIKIPGKNGYSGGITVKYTSLPAYINKYFYSANGDCYREQVQVTLSSFCRTAVNNIQIYPNPAASSATFSSDEMISRIEINSLLNPGSKKVIRVNAKNYLLNTTDLANGVYSCTIITATGSFSEKLIIAR